MDDPVARGLRAGAAAEEEVERARVRQKPETPRRTLPSPGDGLRPGRPLPEHLLLHVLPGRSGVPISNDSGRHGRAGVLRGLAAAKENPRKDRTKARKREATPRGDPGRAILYALPGKRPTLEPQTAATGIRIACAKTDSGHGACPKASRLNRSEKSYRTLPKN